MLLGKQSLFILRGEERRGEERRGEERRGEDSQAVPDRPSGRDMFEKG
jgi:hypothetical protein